MLASNASFPACGAYVSRRRQPSSNNANTYTKTRFVGMQTQPNWIWRCCHILQHCWAFAKFINEIRQPEKIPFLESSSNALATNSFNSSFLSVLEVIIVKFSFKTNFHNDLEGIVERYKRILVWIRVFPFSTLRWKIFQDELTNQRLLQIRESKRTHLHKSNSSYHAQQLWFWVQVHHEMVTWLRIHLRSSTALKFYPRHFEVLWVRVVLNQELHEQVQTAPHHFPLKHSKKA